MPTKPWFVIGMISLLTAGGACGNDFDPPSLVNSVRILATRADTPYAAPGTTVKLEVLAFDGRANQPTPMTVAWIPTACFDPVNDLYYQCYPSFAGAFASGKDVTPQLTAGTTFSYQMPANVISSHLTAAGSGTPFGTAFGFVIACAGHVQYTPSTGGPNANPFGCFDANGAALDANNYVFAYAVNYSFSDRTNTNPAIDHLAFGGNPVDLGAGITVTHCTDSDIDKCPTTPLDTIVPASDQEDDPGSVDSDGNAVKEEIYVDYYVTGGKVKNDTKILYAPKSGAVSDTSVDFAAPQRAGEFMLWAVVHDNRGGADWKQVPVHAL